MASIGARCVTSGVYESTCRHRMVITMIAGDRFPACRSSKQGECVWLRWNLVQQPAR